MKEIEMKIEMPGDFFYQLVLNASYSVAIGKAKDHIYTGYRFEVTGDQIKVVTTDGMTLCLQIVDANKTNGVTVEGFDEGMTELLISGDLLAALKPFAKTREGVTMKIDEGGVSIVTKNSSVKVSLLDKKFVEYSEIFKTLASARSYSEDEEMKREAPEISFDPELIAKMLKIKVPGEPKKIDSTPSCYMSLGKNDRSPILFMAQNYRWKMRYLLMPLNASGFKNDFSFENLYEGRAQ